MGNAVKMPASVDLIVPYLPDGGLRDKNFHYLTSLWEEYYPSLNICVGSPRGASWNKAEALDDAVGKARAKTLIVADADVWCTPTQLIQAVSFVDQRGGWAIPHQKVVRLDEGTSAAWTPDYKGKIKCDRAPYVGVPGGGLFVIRHEDYLDVPMDPRFKGHSGQDIAWAHSADTLISRHMRFFGRLIHLWHPPHPTKGDPSFSKPNFRLMNEYARARGSKTHMRRLVDSARIP